VAEGAIAAGLKEERVRGFPSRAELTEVLAMALAPGDVVLIKGSRSSVMEEVAEGLRARLRTPKDPEPRRGED
jgi:UDP-N-acetylmuramyl pentapeptide synthase